MKFLVFCVFVSVIATTASGNLCVSFVNKRDISKLGLRETLDAVKFLEGNRIRLEPEVIKDSRNDQSVVIRVFFSKAIIQGIIEGGVKKLEDFPHYESLVRDPTALAHETKILKETGFTSWRDYVAGALFKGDKAKADRHIAEADSATLNQYIWEDGTLTPHLKLFSATLRKESQTRTLFRRVGERSWQVYGFTFGETLRMHEDLLRGSFIERIEVYRPESEKLLCAIPGCA